MTKNQEPTPADYVRLYDFFDQDGEVVTPLQIQQLHNDPLILFSCHSSHSPYDIIRVNLHRAFTDGLNIGFYPDEGIINVFEYYDLDGRLENVYAHEQGRITNPVECMDLVKLIKQITFVKKQKKGS